MNSRRRLGLIFGGRSVEHEVSVVSAQHVIAAADSSRFEVVPIGITKDGFWLTPAETAAALAKPDAPFKKTLVLSAERVRPMQFAQGMLTEAALKGSGLAARPAPEAANTIGPDVLSALLSLDVVFPLVHGTHGEDGTMQGFLELLDLPYVGCGVAASAIGMDKALMKAVFASNGIAVVDHVVLLATDDQSAMLERAREIEERLGYPAFVKPSNGGSSVGVSKVRSREELVDALGVAAAHDRKIVIEKGVEAREVECAILGNDNPEASLVGTVVHQRDFYDYEAKYLDPATQVIAPVDLPADVVRRVQELSLQAYRALDCAGMSRVDFFLLADGSLIIDEINTIPGFTPASMFPRLWQAAGVSYSELITRLVDFALTRYREKRIA